MKIITSLGIGTDLYNEEYDWKGSDKSRSLNSLKALYPIIISKEEWKQREDDELLPMLHGYVQTAIDVGKSYFEDHFTDEMIEYFHKAIISYTKYSDDPIYKQVLKEFGWND